MVGRPEICKHLQRMKWGRVRRRACGTQPFSSFPNVRHAAELDYDTPTDVLAVTSLLAVGVEMIRNSLARPRGSIAVRQMRRHLGVASRPPPLATGTSKPEKCSCHIPTIGRVPVSARQRPCRNRPNAAVAALLTHELGSGPVLSDGHHSSGFRSGSLCWPHETSNPQLPKGLQFRTQNSLPSYSEP